MLAEVEDTVNINLTDLLRGGALESTTWTVRAVLVTVCVGVPVIAPVEPFSMRPVGSVPLVSDHIYGGVPPLADRTAL